MTTTETAADNIDPIADGVLYDYATGEMIRMATADDLERSTIAATHDGGRGVIVVADQGTRRCYVWH